MFLQVLTGLDENTTLEELCQGIFNRSPRSGVSVRTLPELLTLHLGYGNITHAALSDLPSLLLGHYMAACSSSLPFTCTFSLEYTLRVPRIIHLEETRSKVEQQKNHMEAFNMHTDNMEANCMILPADRPLRPRTPAPCTATSGLLQVVDQDRAEQSETSEAGPPDRAPTDTASTVDHGDVPDPPSADIPGTTAPPTSNLIQESRYHVDKLSKFKTYRESLRSPSSVTPSVIELTDIQVDLMLQSSSSSDSEPSQNLFVRPPPDEYIDRKVCEMVFGKRKKKTNCKPLKKIILPVEEHVDLPTQNREDRMISIYGLISFNAEHDALDMDQLLDSLDNSLGIKALELFEKYSPSGPNNPVLAKFIFDNRAGMLYENLKKEIDTRIQSSTLIPMACAIDELEETSPQPCVPYCYECKSKHRPSRSCYLQLSGGPSLLTLEDTSISPSISARYDVILYGLTPVYRYLDPLYVNKVLNMSPPYYKVTDGILVGSLREMEGNFEVPITNTLYYDVLNLIQRLGVTCTLPILIEFRPPQGIANAGPDLPQQVETFIRTLALLQKNYSGLIVAIAPLPTWNPGMEISTFHMVKCMAWKAALYLIGFGLVAGVYTIYPDVIDYSTGNETKYILTRPYFKRSYLFDVQGKVSRELKSRICKVFRSEIYYFKSFRSLRINNTNTVTPPSHEYTITYD